jgi:hypothetical protein
MRWYNPSVGDFEWRKVPQSDEEALSLLEGYPGAQVHAEVYQEWRHWGASIMPALIRAGEVARGTETREHEKGEPLA